MDIINFGNLVTLVGSLTEDGFLRPDVVRRLHDLTSPTEQPTPSAVLETTYSQDELISMFKHMTQGRKIEAIKVFRALTGAGLKESKDAVEIVTDRLKTLNW